MYGPVTSVGVEGAVISAAQLIMVLFVGVGRMSRMASRRPAVTIWFLHTFGVYLNTPFNS